MTKAKFVRLKDNSTIPIHFNPSEYDIAHVGSDTGEVRLAGGEKERLRFQLHFDTYMNGVGALREDVRAYTEPIAKLSAREPGSRAVVAFVWGSLNFIGVVESVSQKFTMFTDDGKPVRAVLDVVMLGAEKDEFKPRVTNRGIDWSDENWKLAIAVPNPRVILER